MWNSIAIIAMAIAVACVAVNQIITNFTLLKIQQQLKPKIQEFRTSIPERGKKGDSLVRRL